MSVRHLIPVLGDQLSLTAPAFRDADPERDVVVMAEVDEEIRRHPNHKARVVLFLSAMRHFCDALRAQGYEVIYQRIGDPNPSPSLPEVLNRQIQSHRTERVVLTEPGRYDLVHALTAVSEEAGLPVELREDDHFLCSHAEFEEWAGGRKSLVMEYFYRGMRKRTGYLMEGGKPAGGAWNFDKENRATFGKVGPQDVPAGPTLELDEITRNVIRQVQGQYPDLPGSLASFNLPVSRTQALRVLDDFIQNRLPSFGRFQDAMWTGEPFLFHSRLAPALNMKLLDPREVIEQAIAAHDKGNAPLNSVEGFVRQILGWREYIRGVYWLEMPDYKTRNQLDAHEALPDFFWTGETEMHCIRQVVSQLIDSGYAHHIQRLMVTGLFMLLYGVSPEQVHEWYMAMYVDSVEWVTLPNTIGMSQHADGGVVGTKPYVASGKYINRMSNYCVSCRYSPNEATGEDACPFTTLYWEFLMRHEERFSGNRRMGFQIRNLRRKNAMERAAILDRAREVRVLLSASGA